MCLNCGQEMIIQMTEIFFILKLLLYPKNNVTQFLQLLCFNTGYKCFHYLFYCFMK